MDKIRHLLGPFPQKVNLAPQVLESCEYADYIQEKVEYSVEAGERVRAFVLKPKGRSGRLPAVFCHHQHDGNWVIGKSEVVGLIGNPTLAYAKELAQKGFITIASDAVGFEERNKNQYIGIDILNNYQHQDELTKRIVKGETLLAKALHDIGVAIDYLESRDDVDSEHIGFIGHSYGGVMAIVAPAFDERIQASVSNCGLFSLRQGTPSLELTVPGIATQIDTPDLISAINPRSLCLLVSKNDQHFNFEQATQVYETARTSYDEGELLFESFDGNHIFTDEMKKIAYGFFSRHLVN